MNGPTVLVLDKERRRSPLLSLFYDYISRSGSMLNVVREEDFDKPLENIVQHSLKGQLPDYVHFGWGAFEGINDNMRALCKEISNSECRLIVDVLDIEAFNGAKKADNNFGDCKVDYFVVHTPDHLNCYSVRSIQTIINNVEWANGAKIICVPWGVDPTIGQSSRRDIDVAFICTVNDKWRFHNNRKKIRKELSNLPDSVKMKVGSWWGEEYRTILCRTKIFVVDASMRKFMVQKYLEGSLFGAMLIGDIPANSSDVFEDGETIIGINDIGELNNKILYYLKDDWSREIIAKEARKRVLSRFSVDQTALEYEQMLIREWRD